MRISFERDEVEQNRIIRAPADMLKPFIKMLWASVESIQIHSSVRERLLPTGSMHLVVRLSNAPIRIFQSVDDYEGGSCGFGVVAGLRTRYHVKEVSRPLQTVGAILRPGAARSLFGIHESEFTNRHIPLEELWRDSSTELREKLMDAGGLSEQLCFFESFLTDRILKEHRVLHPVVAYALQRLSRNADIHIIVRETGYSHRRFIELFRTSVGLTPKLYARIHRFQDALDLASKPQSSWIQIACDLGYSDQAHFNREFLEFSGMVPSEFKNLSRGHHVPLIAL